MSKVENLDNKIKDFWPEDGPSINEIEKYIKKYFKLVKDRPGHDLRYALNSKKFYDITKFRLNDSLNSGLIKTIDWYLENKSWTKYVKRKYVNKRIGIND